MQVCYAADVPEKARTDGNSASRALGFYPRFKPAASNMAKLLVLLNFPVVFNSGIHCEYRVEINSVGSMSPSQNYRLNHPCATIRCQFSHLNPRSLSKRNVRQHRSKFCLTLKLPIRACEKFFHTLNII